MQELEDKTQEMSSTVEDLQQQVGVLTEERDLARVREEELFELINEKAMDSSWYYNAVQHNVI